MKLQKILLSISTKLVFLQHIQTPLLGQFFKSQKQEVVFCYREDICIYSFLKDQVYDHCRGKILEQLETSYHITIII